MRLALAAAFVGSNFYCGAVLGAPGLGSPVANDAAAKATLDTGASIVAPEPEPSAPESTPPGSDPAPATPSGVTIDLATLRPIGMLGDSYNEAELPVSKIRAQAGVVAVVPGSLSVGHKSDVQPYTIGLISVRSRKQTQVHNADARFGSAARDLLRKAGPGDVVTFTSIQTLYPDGATRPATLVVISRR